MAKQGKGGPTPPDDKNPGESDILEVFPEEEPAPPKPRPKKQAPETQLGSPDWVEEADVLDAVEVVEDAGPAAPPPVPPKPEQAGAKAEDPKGQAAEPAVSFEEIHEVELWEDEPAEVEEAKGQKPAEPPAAPAPKAPPDDVAGADDFVEIIDPAATQTATAPPRDLPVEDVPRDVTPGPQSTPTGKGDVSARADKIAEALESGTDLTGERKALVQPPPVQAPEVDYASDLDKGGESSAVDLGEPAPPKEGDKAGSADAFLGAALAEAEPRAFVGRQKPADEEEPVEVVAAEDEEPPAKPAKAAKERPERKGFAGLPWAAGILIGVVLGGGAAAGLAFTGLLGPGEKKSPPVQAGPKTTPAQQAQSALARGDYDEAIRFVQDADKSSPEELTVRGEARWLKYLKEQQGKKSPPSADAPEVKQALADLKEANDEVRQQQILLALRPADSGPSQMQLKESEAKLAAVRKQLEAVIPETDPVKGTGVLVKTVQENRKILEGLKKSLAQNQAAQKSLTEVEALLKVKGGQVAKNVAQLVQTRNELDASLAQINKQLKEAKVPAEGPQGVGELVAAKNKLETERGRLDAAVQQAIKELEAGNLLPPGAKPQDLVAGIKAARKRADSPLADSIAKGVSALAGLSDAAVRLTQQGAKDTLLQTELALYRMREPLIKTPDKNLDSWITTLRSGPPATPTDLNSAKRDADWVLANTGRRDPALKLKAEFVQAMVAKNRGESAQARALLDRVVKDAADLKPAPQWVTDAKLVQQQFTDANSFYVPAARELVAQGRWKEALAKLDEGLSVLPNNGRLLALRSEVRLHLSGTLKKDEAAKLRDEARKEAEAATKDAASAAEAFFTLGRIDEEQGDLAQAESHYRQAIKRSQGQPEVARRYRAALARVLLMRLDASPVDVPVTKERKTGRLAPPRSFKALLAAVLTGVVGGDENPAEDKRLREVLDLANELLKSENREDKGNAHLLLGKVYTRQGKRTEGLREYVLGLQLLYPGLATKDLTRLIDEHPAFQQPDALARPNVAAAAVHYSRGLQRFRDRQYARAEEDLKQAVANSPDDARYLYYLGLARYMQKGRAKRETAVFDFEQAARLERQNRPDSVAVNASFERLPFDLRQMLGRYRQKSPAPVAEEDVLK